MRKILNYDREALIAEPLPVKTETYTPIANSLIINTMIDYAREQGLEMRREDYRMTGDRQAVIGYYDFTGPDNDLGFRVAFRNSYDKSMSFGVAFGASVWICSNGMVSGEVTAKRKHTGDSDEDAYNYIVEGFVRMIGEYRNLIEMRDSLKDKGCTMDQVSYLLGWFLMNGFITTQQFNIIKYQLYKSENFHHINSDNFSAWDLYNHCTESLKISHPVDYISNHINVHRTFLKQFIHTANVSEAHIITD